jgi:hypothetical protein
MEANLTRWTAGFGRDLPVARRWPPIPGLRPGLTDFVEKLISQAHGIVQVNSEVAENPHETHGMAHCAQLWSEIVGNRSPLGSLEFQPF